MRGEMLEEETAKKTFAGIMLYFLLQLCIFLSTAAQILCKKKKTNGMTEFCARFLEHLLENL